MVFVAKSQIFYNLYIFSWIIYCIACTPSGYATAHSLSAPSYIFVALTSRASLVLFSLLYFYPRLDYYMSLQRHCAGIIYKARWTVIEMRLKSGFPLPPMSLVSEFFAINVALFSWRQKSTSNTDVYLFFSQYYFWLNINYYTDIFIPFLFRLYCTHTNIVSA